MLILHVTFIRPDPYCEDVVWNTLHVKSLPLSDLRTRLVYNDVTEYLSLPRGTTSRLVSGSGLPPSKVQLTLTARGRNPDAVQRAVRTVSSTTELLRDTWSVDGRTEMYFNETRY